MLNQSYLGKYNFLLITLDSCGWECYNKANTPNADSFCVARKVHSAGYYTLPSHMSIFRGFLPSNYKEEGYYNKRNFLTFRMKGAIMAPGPEIGISFNDNCATLAEAFMKNNYHTIGIGGVSWFDPNIETGGALRVGFEDFWYDSKLLAKPDSLDYQLKALSGLINKNKKKKFVFLNVNATHLAYSYGQRLGYKKEDPECQVKCVEYFDNKLPELLDMIPKPLFVILTADHGDLFGEDGLWGHKQYHHKLHEVPMAIFEIN